MTVPWPGRPEIRGYIPGGGVGGEAYTRNVYTGYGD